MNVADLLSEMARQVPSQRAIVVPHGRDRNGRVAPVELTFEQLERECCRYALGLSRIGIGRGARTLLMVRPGVEFFVLTFALFKIGAVPVFIDPGMPKKWLFASIAEVEPQAMIAIPLAHAISSLVPGPFRSVRIRVTVGHRWFWRGHTLESIRVEKSEVFPTSQTTGDDIAAILFTSGSTGPPKGAVYQHRIFIEQVHAIRSHYQIETGEIDLPTFPLFALFTVAMGMTAVIPQMNPSRPASVDPHRIVEAIGRYGVTSSFGSPALWERVGHYCAGKQISLASVRRIIIAGAPVAASIVKTMRHALAHEGRVHTPYGATEALPVTSISDVEILNETAAQTRTGGGICVGKPLPGMRVSIIRVTDAPIPSWDASMLLPDGEIGEIVVRGPVVTHEYFRRPRATALAKIADGEAVWHRMGDLGYLDAQGRLWFCGRKRDRVTTAARTLYSVCCEAIFNQYPAVRRAALVGIGEAANQRPVIVVELKAQVGRTSAGERAKLFEELRALGQACDHTRCIQDFLQHPGFPVDARHNAKIDREQLRRWAARKLK
jgi:acyl-CoA synthetase (AMP-forming)/AMP-acid ligase II